MLSNLARFARTNTRDIFGFTGNGNSADPLQGPGCDGIAIALNNTCTNPGQTQCANATPQPSTFTMHQTSQGFGYRVDPS